VTSLALIIGVGLAILLGAVVLGLGLRFARAYNATDGDADESVDRTTNWARGLIMATLGGAFSAVVVFGDVLGGIASWLGSHPLAGSNILTAGLGAAGLRGLIGISAVQLVMGAVLVVVVVYLASRTADETDEMGSVVGLAPLSLLGGVPIVDAVALTVAIGGLALLAVWTVDRVGGDDDDPTLRKWSSGVLGSASMLVSGTHVVGLVAIVVAGASVVGIGYVPGAIVIALAGLVAVHAVLEVSERRD
jgi:hypothetical protein